MKLDQNAPANWIGIVALADPLLHSESCGEFLDTALYSGIPRGLNDLASTDGFLPLLDAVIRRDEPVEYLLELHEHRAKWESETAIASVLVTLGRRYDREQIVEARKSLNGRAADVFDPWLFSIGMAQMFLEMSARSADAHRGMTEEGWTWTPQLESFFAARSYRGLRRSAARHGARSWTKAMGERAPALLATAPPEAFFNLGFRAFCAEWLYAQGNCCWKSSSIEQTGIAELVKIGRLLQASEQSGLNSEEWSVKAVKEFHTRLESGRIGELDD
ncbi:hypothetical protein OAG62_00510 [bacterium]|nr:hypothetical protein [bacterium]